MSGPWKDHLSLTLPLAPCGTLTLTTKAGPRVSLVSGLACFMSQI